MRSDSHTRFRLPSLTYKANLLFHLHKERAFARKLKSKEFFVSLSLFLFSCCTLIVMYCYLSFDPSIYPATVFAQESNPTRTGDNDTSQNKIDVIRSSNASINNSIHNMHNDSNNELLDSSESEFTPNRLITLVTEDVEINIAPGERVKAWTFNGTVPGPTIRIAEGENVTIKYINKSPIPHTIHFHGNHDDVNDGVIPQVMPGQTYLYNITGEPAGALMYHCHAPPTSLHIRMGMYGALIVDPVDKQKIAPAKEFVMVIGEYSLKNQLGFDADYYLINGYADQYVHNPLEINQDDLIRIYLINLGTTIPASFHLHSTTFLTYPSGLWANTPILSQTVSVAPGDASIVEAKWKYPGNYFFHAHGIQEEKGNMGQIKVIGQEEILERIEAKISNNSNTTYHDLYQTNNNVSEPSTKSVSMFDWQYQLQKKLQDSKVVPQSEHKGIDREEKKILKQTANTSKFQEHGENHSPPIDKNPLTNNNNNISNNNNNNVSSNFTLIDNEANEQHKYDSKTSNANPISIVLGSSNPDSKLFYEPSHTEVKLGTEVTWINDDTNMPHTVTSGNSDIGPTGVFDSGIINGGGGLFNYKFDEKGTYEYYCTLHPWMNGMITVK